MTKVLSFAVLMLCVTVTARAECTREEAFNKMSKLNELNAKLQAEVPLDPRKDPEASNAAYERIKDYTDRIAPAGKMLADGKYSEACKLYEETAAHFGFDLKASKALSMAQVANDGGRKNAGECDLTEMAKRNVQLATDFQRAYSAGKFTFEKQRQFSKDSEKLNMLGASDPGAACKEIDALRAKYGL